MFVRRLTLGLVLAATALVAAPLGIGCGGSHGGSGRGATSDVIQMNPAAGSTLPPGTVATVYTQTFAASGGTPPYTFTAVSIPPGLSLAPVDGEAASLSGTPTTAGTSTITLQVVDSTNANVTNPTYSITIR